LVPVISGRISSPLVSSSFTASGSNGGWRRSAHGWWVVPTDEVDLRFHSKSALGSKTKKGSGLFFSPIFAEYGMKRLPGVNSLLKTLKKTVGDGFARSDECTSSVCLYAWISRFYGKDSMVGWFSRIFLNLH